MENELVLWAQDSICIGLFQKLAFYQQDSCEIKCAHFFFCLYTSFRLCSVCHRKPFTVGYSPFHSRYFSGEPHPLLLWNHRIFFWGKKCGSSCLPETISLYVHIIQKYCLTRNKAKSKLFSKIFTRRILTTEQQYQLNSF